MAPTTPTAPVSPRTATTERDATNQRRRLVLRWVVGCVFLVLVAVIWNFSSVLIQYIFNDLSFEAPFFLTAFGMSLFTVNLPIYYLTKILWPELRQRYLADAAHETLPLVKPTDAAGTRLDSSAGTAPERPVAHSRPVLRRTMLAALVVAPLWFVANFTYNESLKLTSVTSSTILSATSSVFTLIFGVWILKERFTWAKLLGVALCMAGNCSTLAKDTSGGISDYFWGDVCALVGAIMYGVYTTAIRHRIPDDSGISVSLFFGFVGLFSFLGLAAFVLLFHYTGVESLRNLTPEIIGLLFVQGLVNNVLADYLWAVAILYTSTTVATVGLSLTVPMAIISDWIIHDIAPTYITIISSVLVLAGFIVISLSTRQDQIREMKNQADHEAEPTTPGPSKSLSPAAAAYKELDH